MSAPWWTTSWRSATCTSDIRSRRAVVHAVDGVSFEVPRGEAIGLVGESGCGKSMTLRAHPRRAAAAARVIVGGEVRFDGTDLRAAAVLGRLNDVRGRRISMIFQEPMTRAEPGHAGRRPDRRGAAGAPGLQPAAGGGTGAGADAPGRHPRPGAAGRGVPARVLGRHAPARDDRHRAVVRARGHPVRRADDRAGRHHPGPDPASCWPACARELGREPAVRDPRPAVVAQIVPAAGRDVRAGRSSRRGTVRRRVPRATAPVHAGPAPVRARLRAASATSLVPIPAAAARPDPRRRRGAASTRAARSRRTTAGRASSRCGRSAGGRATACIHYDACAAAGRRRSGDRRWLTPRRIRRRTAARRSSSMRDVGVSTSTSPTVWSSVRGGTAARACSARWTASTCESCRGEALGLVGESGSGKSTLARALVGLQPLTARRDPLRRPGAAGRAIARRAAARSRWSSRTPTRR